MKNFFGGIFIDKEKLRKVGIEHPIKVEYYKITNEDEVLKQHKEKYGIQIIKTEYKQDIISIEQNELPNITNDENYIEEILKLLKSNEVTPVSLTEIISDLKNKNSACLLN